GSGVSVALGEKGSEIGAHIMSGAILDPCALDELVPDWRERGAPVTTPVTQEKFFILGPAGAMDISWLPMPPFMRNHGNYVISLGELCRWLAQLAEAMGVEIYPGMAASEIVYGANGEVAGIIAGEFGIAKDGHKKPGYQPGLIIQGKYSLFAEGARGSLSQQVIEKF